ncbi:MAG TPA: aminotransferase class V-fold PLP-dependent enzyme [Polyangiaceae bacterium]|nr:aminotransferase class V-fold PLP-dependent enzyme [Polyangiaceae bacterium]
MVDLRPSKVGASRDARSLAELRSAYSTFLGEHAGHVLLTGHSHQAWPDVAQTAMQRAFADAARHVDGKWGAAVFPLMDRVGRRVLSRLSLPETDPITFGRSTHELVFRLLSALAPDARVVTTSSEFHSLDRQLKRLEEDGLRVTWVDGSPRSDVAERVIDAIVPGVSLVAVSAVFFEDAFILPRLPEIVGRARDVGALVLVDAYHAFNVAPLDLGPHTDHVFVTAGGYKYAAWGEGACFLRSPPGCKLRPRYTGWFADFDALEGPRGGAVGYADGGARFAGATFDPVALYRAEAVLDHWDRFGLDVARLREISVLQTSRIVTALADGGVSVASFTDDARRAGFVAARVAGAHAVAEGLRREGVFVDARGDLLRLGPAPYLADEEIDRGVAAVIRAVTRR